jgi:hypothetical protein
MPVTPTTDLSPFEALSTGRYAFLDLGCGAGGSLVHCTRRFGLGPGLGLELEADLVDEARRAGYDAFPADVSRERVPDRSVRYLSAMDFLEHLPDEPTALAVLERFSRAAREFVFIRHPSFEDIDYLAERGLKLCWTDWALHPNMMRIADYVEAFARFGWNEYVILPRQLISDSTSDQVVALDAPADIIVYDPELHGPKPHVVFDRPVYTQFDIFVKLDPKMDDEVWAEILATDDGPEVAGWQAIFMPPRPALDPAGSREAPGSYDTATGRFGLRFRPTDGAAEHELTFGGGGLGWRAFAGDFDGDGWDGIGVYDPKTGDFFLKNTPGEGEADVQMRLGAPGGIPVAGDWNGDGRDTIGIYYPETGRWFLRDEHASGDADYAFSFGRKGSPLVPVAGDWDGDGRDSVGLYDPETGEWSLRNDLTDGSADVEFTYGPPGALPVAGDWDGDGRDSIGFYLPSTGEWHLRDDHSNGPADLRFTFDIGDAGPLAGRWRR